MNANPAGHLISEPDRVTGRNGIAYDYVMAREGIYVQSQSTWMTARVLYLPGTIRGLAASDEKLILHNGKIPASLVDMGISWMMTAPAQERFFAITLDEGRYRLTIPDNQRGTASSLTYEMPEAKTVVAQFHSHGLHEAYFSPTDDQDEQGLAIYGVIGLLNHPEPVMSLRVGVYGHFSKPRWEDIFTTRPKAIIIKQDQRK